MAENGANLEAARALGRTGLRVGRLAISSGYGLPGEGVERAFAAGQNFIHFSGRVNPTFASAAANLAKERRGEVVLALHSYSRVGALLRRSVEGQLKKLGVEAFDFLILGYWQKKPGKGVAEAAAKLKDEGKVRHLGIAGHNRPLFAEFDAMGVFDLMMARYNAAHRGAEEEIFPHFGPHLGKETRPGIATYTTTRWGDLLNPKKMPKGEATPSAGHCYRFALSHPAVDAAFCAPKNVAELEEALACLAKGPLGEDEMNWMRRVGDHVREKHKKIFL